MALIVERNRAANDVRIGIEAALPQAVADDGDALAARAVFNCENVASERELRAESGKEVRGDHAALHPLRLTRAGQRRFLDVITGDTLEPPALLAPFEEVRAGNRTVRRYV